MQFVHLPKSMNQETNSTLQFAEDFPHGTRQLEELKAPL